MAMIASKRDGLALGEPEVDEPVRRVVLAALLTGRRSARRTIVTSVVSRIGIASTSSGRRIVATVVPAVVQLAASPSAASGSRAPGCPSRP